MPDTSSRGADTAVKRRGHLRLIAFFAALAAGGAAIGAAWLSAVGASREGSLVLAVTLSATMLAALVGVIVHRSTIAKIRWRETDEYLARIERESEKYHALMEGAADMLLIVDPRSGRVRESNAMAREALGLAASPRGDRDEPRRAEPSPRARSDPSPPGAPPSREEPLVDSILAETDRARFRSALERADTAPAPQASLSEVHLLSGDRALVADVRFAAIDFGGERVVQVSLRDLSKEKEMERQLQIRERLSSIGLLTAGVAHEINNPLEGIGNYIALLEKKDLGEEQRKRYLELVRHGFTRIADLVRDLLRFARPAAGEGSADLAGVVDRALKLVAYTETFKGIEVERVGLDRPIVIVGDSGRLEQVVFNLLLNAATAMGSRGKIVLRVERVAENGTGASGERGGESAPMIDLSIEDEGPGIQREHMDRIFDPFFTTSGGTGLGLAVSYGIVRAHGGTLRAENRAPRGARFTMRLPWPRAAESSSRKSPA
jgi:signal transduction histidine kinase